jgi:hypothetical protein
MTTIRRIVTSKIDGNDANANNTDEIRPFGETAFYLDTDQNSDALTLMMFDGTRTHVRSKVLRPGVFYGSNENSSDGNGFDTIKLIPDSFLDWDSEYQNDQYIVIEPTGGEPGHIHVRAGGPIDQSTADLFLGGEINHVKVSDTNSAVNINSLTNAFISIGNPLVSGVDVATVDELIPPGDVWRLFINSNIYPALGVSVQIGGTVTTIWGTQITATITDIQQDNNTDRWVIHVDQDITEGFDAGPQTVSFDSSYKTWAFGQNGNLQFPGSSNGRIGEDEPGLVVYSDLSFGILTNVANTENSKAWIFTNDGRLTFPSGGAIESVGMGWMGVTNGTAGNPVSVLNKNTDGDQRSSVSLYNSDTYGTAEILTVNAPGIPDGGNINTATSTGSWDANPLLGLTTTGGSGTGLTVDVNEPGSGYADFVTVVNPGSGYLDGETITVTSGEASATFVIDVQEYNHQWTFNETGITTLPGGIQGNVKSNTYVDTTIELDVTAAINKIVPTTTAGGDKYSLADGIEGQIMYLVPATGGEQMDEYTEMSFAHARWTNGNGVINEGTDVSGWLPFQNLNTSSVILTLIFTDGHWNLPHNNFD